MCNLARRIVLCLIVIVASISVCAGAAQEYLLIFQVSEGANIKAIAQAYDAKVLDSLGGNTYLLQAKLLSPRNGVYGVISVEPNTSVSCGSGKGWLVSVNRATPPTGTMLSQPFS